MSRAFILSAVAVVTILTMAFITTGIPADAISLGA